MATPAYQTVEILLSGPPVGIGFARRRLFESDRVHIVLLFDAPAEERLHTWIGRGGGATRLLHCTEDKVGWVVHIASRHDWNVEGDRMTLRRKFSRSQDRAENFSTAMAGYFWASTGRPKLPNREGDLVLQGSPCLLKLQPLDHIFVRNLIPRDRILHTFSPHYS